MNPWNTLGIFSIVKDLHKQPNDWVLYFPQFHALILQLVLLAIGLMALILITVAFIALIVWKIYKRGNGTCPCCHKETLVSKCISPDCHAVLVGREAGGLIPASPSVVVA